MSFPKNNQDLLNRISDVTVAKMISAALRLEHGGDSSSVKQISAKAKVSRHTISKWYQAMNAPKSAHMLALASIYPEVLKGILLMIGRQDIWQYCLLKDIPNKMRRQDGTNISEGLVYSDKFVHIDVILNRKIASQMNERQLWFVGEIQKGHHIRAGDITNVWGKTLRTARRDVKEVLRCGIIEYRGARKNGYYRLC